MISQEETSLRSLQRWRRFLLRLWDRQIWHLRGLVLWLCSRSYLRFVPYPYPSVSTVRQWQLQAQAMVAEHTLISRHLTAANNAGAFTAQNLIEMSKFRDRVGWTQAFLEDSLLSGFLAVKALRGQKYQLKVAAMEEARQQAQRDIASGQKVEAARQLIGPRGGLPSLRADLVRLAALLEVDLDAKDTVAQIQKKVRPMVDLLKAQVPEPKAKAAPSRPSTTVTTPVASSMRSWQLPTGPTAEDLEQRMQELIAQQDQRFQTMLMPVLQHIINVSSNPGRPDQSTAAFATPGRRTSDEDLAMEP